MIVKVVFGVIHFLLQAWLLAIELAIPERVFVLLDGVAGIVTWFSGLGWLAPATGLIGATLVIRFALNAIVFVRTAYALIPGKFT